MNLTTVLCVIIPFLFFGALNTLTTFISGKNFGRCLPVTLMASGFVMYLSQLIFNTFDIGFYVLIGTLVISVVIYRGRGKSIIDSLRGYGFVAFITLYLGILFFDFGRRFTAWDEFGHWGMMVKEMLRLDKFYCVDESHLLIHKDYPPFIGVFQTLWCKMTGGYSEMGVSMAVHLMEFSLIVPCALEKEERKDPVKNIFYAFLILIVSVIIICALDYEFILTTIYADLLLCLLFVYSVILIFKKEALYSGFGYISLLLAESAIILTKQMGLSYILIISLFFFSIGLTEYFQSKKALDLRKMILCFAGTIVVPVVNMIIWKKYYSKYGIEGQFDLEKISYARLTGILFNGEGTWLQKATVKNYFHTVFAGTFNNAIEYIGIPLCSVFIGIAIFLIWRQNRKILSGVYMIELGVTFLIGTIGMIMLMLVMYLFCFSETEMDALVSLERYLGTFVMGEFMILFMIVIFCMEKEDFKLSRIKLCGTVATLFLCLCLSIPDIMIFYFGNIYDSERTVKYQNDADYIRGKTGDETRVFVLGADLIDEYPYVVQYYANGLELRGAKYIKQVGIEGLDEKTVHAMAEETSECDYLVVTGVNDVINGVYSKYNHGKNIEAPSLYKVKKRENGFLLEEVEV